MGVMGNEPSNLGMLPRAKALLDGPMLIPNPWWGSYWDSRAVTEGLAEVFCGEGVGCLSAQPVWPLLPVTGRRG